MPEIISIEDAVLIKETDGAYLIQKDGDEVWIPKSQVSEFQINVNTNEITSFKIPLWLAEKNNLS